jgi:hypothetical protein
MANRKIFYKFPSPEKKARPERWCVVCEKHRKRKNTVHWCDACDGLCVECFRDYHTKLNFQGNKILFFTKFYKFTGTNVILKQFGTDTLILCTFLNIVSKLEKKKSKFTAVEMKCYIVKL